MSVSRLPNGLSTALPGTAFGDLPIPDPRSVHMFFDDFDTYIATDWLVTEVGTASQVLLDGDGGLLLIANSGADDDSSFSQKSGESFLFETGKKLWFDCKFQVDDAIQSDVIIGLQITDTTPLDVSDGVFFLKVDGAATVDFVVEKDDVATTTAAVATLVDDTDIRLSFFYNGIDKIKVFVGDVGVASSVITNLPDDEELTISFGIQNGEAVPKNMLLDYVLVAKER